jgi:hypothetical protein
MMTFLLDMTDRPTSVLDLTLETTVYSPTLEEEEIEPVEPESEESVQLRKARMEFHQTVVEELLESRIDVSYSSDSDLSVSINK